MKNILLIIQIISSLVLITLILSQAKGVGLSTVFGGDGGVYRTKRGFEKMLHYLTIFTSIIFFSISLISVLIG